MKALISVYDKSGLDRLAGVLIRKGFSLVSSGGTAKYLQECGFAVQLVEELTSFPEMLDGRVKTLHPKVHAGILNRRDHAEDQASLSEWDIEPIDLVVVNLYPFVETAAKPNISFEEVIEQIDIGGPSLLRSAAKNHAFVTVLSSPSQYADFISKLEESEEISLTIRGQYAQAAFALTAQYDSMIADYLAGGDRSMPEKVIELYPSQSLRYGENPHQTAKLYRMEPDTPWQGLNSIKQHAGKELSYNNWLDMESAWALISEFEPELPACGIVKHNSPCGVALGETLAEAFVGALDSDPVSAFGGVVALNQSLNPDTARKLKDLFLEVIIAPGYAAESLEILAAKKNLRLIEAQLIPPGLKFPMVRSVFGNGILIQDYDQDLIVQGDLKVVTEAQPTQEDWLELLFAFRVVKHVRSNGIVLVKGPRTVGICGGQTNRLSSVNIAIGQACDLATESVLASDGFFPFADNVESAAAARIKAIIQPGGSIRDQEVIDSANRHKIPMVFTNMRHFKH